MTYLYLSGLEQNNVERIPCQRPGLVGIFEKGSEDTGKVGVVKAIKIIQTTK